MTEKNTVLFQGREAGSLTVRREGAFCCYHARCDLPADRLYRLLLKTGAKTIPLGVFVPQEDKFVSVGRIPQKTLDHEEIVFAVQGLYEDQSICILDAEQPFSQLDKLETGVLTVMDGKTAVQFIQDP